MAKFKVGDKVMGNPRSDGSLHPDIIKDEVYLVVDVAGGMLELKGKFTRGDGEGWSEDWFTLYKSATKSAEALREEVIALRSKQKELQQEIVLLVDQEEQAILQLKELGFVLCDPEQLSEKEVVTEDITDPRNWKVGDMVECIDSVIEPLGTLREIKEIRSDRIYRENGENCSVERATDFWKFHSRPHK